MNQSASIAQLAEALSAAQAEMETAKKDSNNPFFRSKYADLSSVWAAIRAPLSRHGLAVVQLPETDEHQGVVITTILMHSSGEFISSQLRVVSKEDTPQGLGSALTYGRRYSLAAVTGCAPDDASDDDGNAASGKKPEATTEAAKVFSRPKEKTTAASLPPDNIKAQADAVTAAIAPPARTPAYADGGDSLEFIDTKTQQDFAGLFRESLPAAYRKEAEVLRHDWLGLRGYVDDHGNPSSKMIPRKDYVVAKRMAITWATEYGSGR